MQGLTDAQGLVPDNAYMVVYIPETKSALVHRVVNRANNLSATLEYGALPLIAGDSMPTYDGSSVDVPETGVLPARAYSRNGSGIRFPLANAWDVNDMFYTPDDYRRTLMHVIVDVHPAITRLDLQIPSGMEQGKFQRSNVSMGIDRVGTALPRGRIETAFIPEVGYALMVGNDTNINFNTGVRFTYGEYTIESVKNPYTVLDVLMGQRAASWITLPVTYYSNQLQQALRNAYGYEGFPVYPRDARDREESRTQIIANYTKIIQGMMI